MPGLTLVDPSTDVTGQIIYLNFDGADDVIYNGPVTVGPFDVPAFEAPGELAGQKEEVIASVLEQLEETFADSGVIFTTEQPVAGVEYSTIYIGGDDSAFGEYGEFFGLSETVDIGNLNKTDEGFVFANTIEPFGSTVTAAHALARTVEHETAHMLGYKHDGQQPGSGILHQVAADAGNKPDYEARVINLENGGVTISGHVGGNDTNDYFQIAVPNIAGFNVLLSELNANLDLELIEDTNNDGARQNSEVIKASKSSGNSYEFIQHLPDDDSLLYVRVYPSGSAESDYSIRFTGGDRNAAPPNPDLVSVSGIPDTVKPGESFTVTVVVENDSGLGGPDSAITASVVHSAGSSHVDLSAPDISNWGGDESSPNYAISRSPGDTIYKKGPEAMAAIHHLVEAGDKNWKDDERHEMSFTVTPDAEGTLSVRVRTTMRYGVHGIRVANSDDDWMINDHTVSGGSDGIDQQGWDVEEYTVTVAEPKPDLIVDEVTGVSDFYQLGEKINARVWVKNQVDGDADESFWVYYYLGKADGSNNEYRSIEDGKFTGGLDAHERDDDIINFPGWTIPQDVEQGDYRIWVKADIYNNVDEGSEEGNNWGSSELFTIGHTPQDLQVPYFNQWYTKWCALTSTSMLLKYYGYDRAPWEVAADFDKAPQDPGLHALQLPLMEEYLEQYYDGGSSDAWEMDHYWDSNSAAVKIQEILSSGHPVWLAVPDANHSIVATGFDGIRDEDHIYINDPSGAFADSPLIHHKLTWASFKSKATDDWFNLLYNVGMIYAKAASLVPVPSVVSTQVLPSKIDFINYKVGVGGRSITMEWDGSEPYSGYKYVPIDPSEGWYQPDSDGLFDNYGYNATQADLLTVSPSYSNFALDGSTYYVRARVEIRRATDNALVDFASSEVNTLDPFSWVESWTTSGVSLPLADISPDVYKLVVIAEGNTNNGTVFEPLDEKSFYFGVTQVPRISVDSVNELEGDSGTTDFEFTVSVSNAGDFSATVDYETKNGTAFAPNDYSSVNGTLTFQPGETTKTIKVPVIGDKTTETDKMFYLTLSNALNATIGDAEGGGTITNDDFPPDRQQFQPGR